RASGPRRQRARRSPDIRPWFSRRTTTAPGGSPRRSCRERRRSASDRRFPRRRRAHRRAAPARAGWPSRSLPTTRPDPAPPSRAVGWRARALRAELHAPGDVAAAAAVAQLPHQLLDLGVVVEALDSLFQDQIRAHTPRGEGPHPVFILSAVGMTVEVPHPGPGRILEQLDEEKRRLGIVAAEPQVLVESPR